ncbi:hypothetical protein BAUCODRAFT_29188 [Baudoinia panamericana UAMH 10762]|uniref:SMP domain-containing protein n=1 Tax=Baudoinia panamericana (strain UAMH 10762) TaxID=717646 RepID=M2NMP9_BAUPA|nr:uncharacterized protein BAUCODRAFT_29188 [Baudoinia panamericana UAMH 10762]EMD00810.1 hypothetical protein BAUCODRAFT_29188 [Baudoinia panamericana UAMH 10762]
MAESPDKPTPTTATNSVSTAPAESEDTAPSAAAEHKPAFAVITIKPQVNSEAKVHVAQVVEAPIFGSAVRNAPAVAAMTDRTTTEDAPVTARCGTPSAATAATKKTGGIIGPLDGNTIPSKATAKPAEAAIPANKPITSAMPSSDFPNAQTPPATITTASVSKPKLDAKASEATHSACVKAAAQGTKSDPTIIDGTATLAKHAVREYSQPSLG